MKKTRILPQATLLLCLTLTLASCGLTESVEEKAQRPRKIAKHWVLDTSALRKEYVGYTEASWKTFEASIQDKDQIPQSELDKMKKKMAEYTDVSYRNYCRLSFIFRSDGTYENRYVDAKDVGTYRFNKTFDVIQTKSRGKKKEYAIPLLALSDTEMQIQGGIPIVTGPTKGPNYKIIFTYVPKPKS